VWYIVDGTAIVFNTGAETIKGRNLANDARVTLVVDGRSTAILVRDDRRSRDYFGGPR
jgi:predicted alpha/beta superfamily hydrolase